MKTLTPVVQRIVLLIGAFTFFLNPTMAQVDAEQFFDDDDLKLLQVEPKKSESAPSPIVSEAKEDAAPKDDSFAKHVVGANFGIGPSFSRGFNFALSFTAEYKYMLLNGHLGAGAKLGMLHYSTSFVSFTSFLGVASVDYFILFDKWKPYGSVDIGGIAGDFDAFLLSPGLGSHYSLSDRIDLDASFRFPIAFVTGGENASMLINLGAHFKF